MEAYTTLPVDYFGDTTNILEEDPSNYFSLSQFDLELQQQAQAALLQQNSWQDFDKYLPIDNELFNSTVNNDLRNEQAQPIFLNNNNLSDFNQDPSLLYEPINNLFPPQQTQIEPSQQNQIKPSQEFNTNNHNNITLSTPEQQPDIILDNDNQQQQPLVLDKNLVKQEYASPESLPYSPPQNPSLNLSNQFNNDMPSLFQNFNSTDKTKLNSSPIDFMNWNSLSVLPIDSTPGKVPIQRLKSNSIINNAVNAALNNTTPNTGRQHKKTAHNAIERRYRNNINDRITELKNAVPALLHAKVKENNRNGKRSQRDDDEEEGEDGEDFLDGVAVATKLNKATILKKATEYINHLKKTGDDIRRENETLQKILVQLPGGADILQRYHAQKLKREEELHRQQIKEREALKLQEQQRKAANRKRARLNNAHHDQHHSDDYEGSSSSPGSMSPATPPAITNRVFMAIFMCITFFSTSPLTTGPSSSEQYQNHHHPSKPSVPIAEPFTETTVNSNTSSNFFLNSFFKFDDGWSTLRTIIFIICITQLFFPYIKHILFGSSLKLKRVNRSKRNNTASSRKEILNNTVAPGDLKCRQIYHILEKSIKREGGYLPDGTLSTVFSLIKELFRFFSHHVLGYDILYGQYYQTPEEEWAQLCKWIKLNEIRCIGGDPSVTRLSMLHSCLHMINLVDALDEDQHGEVDSTYARAYGTAAIQMSLIFPNRFIMDKLSDYFWFHVVAHFINHSDEGNLDDSHVWMEALGWNDPEQPDNKILYMRDTRAWAETISLIQNQAGLGSDSFRSSLSISYTAPVIVPVSILSTFHLLDSLRHQFDRLVNLMSTSSSAPKNTNHKYDVSLESGFFDIMLLTKTDIDDNTQDDQQRLVHWLATIGVVVESLWRNKLDQVEDHVATLIRCAPRSISCKNATQKPTMNQLDELIKKTMIHILVGTLLLKDNQIEKQKQGLVELENAEVLRSAVRKLQNKNRPSVEEAECDLESVVMAYAEFVVSFVGLESWIGAMKLPSEKEGLDEQVREVTLHLRRMIRYPSLQLVSDNPLMVDRLSRLGRFIAHHPGDADSTFEFSDNDEDDDQISFRDNSNSLFKKADKAQLILRGLA